MCSSWLTRWCRGSQQSLVQGFDKYIKKKALDPLVSYIPVILIASEQLEYVQLAAADLGCEETRSLLRKGAFVGLRDNIRSVGEYSSAICGKDTAQVRVKRVFASLEALDGALLVVRSPWLELEQLCNHYDHSRPVQ